MQTLNLSYFCLARASHDDFEVVNLSNSGQVRLCLNAIVSYTIAPDCL